VEVHPLPEPDAVPCGPQVADQLDAIPFLCRFQYARTAEYLLRFLDPLVAAYTEAATPGGLPFQTLQSSLMLHIPAVPRSNHMLSRFANALGATPSAVAQRTCSTVCRPGLCYREGGGAGAGSHGGAAHVAGAPGGRHHPRPPVLLVSRVPGGEQLIHTAKRCGQSCGGRGLCGLLYRLCGLSCGRLTSTGIECCRAITCPQHKSCCAQHGTLHILPPASSAT
jgi:hypothetical protein